MTPSTDDSFDIAKWAGGLLVGGALAVFRFFGGGERKALRKAVEASSKALESFKDDFDGLRDDLRGIRDDMREDRQEVSSLRKRVDNHIDAYEQFRHQILYRSNGR